MKRLLIFTLLFLLAAAGAAGARRGEDRAGMGRTGDVGLESTTQPTLPRNDNQEQDLMSFPYPPPAQPVEPYPYPVETVVPYPYPEPYATAIDPCLSRGGTWINPWLCRLPTPTPAPVWTPIATKTPEACPSVPPFDPNCG